MELTIKLNEGDLEQPSVIRVLLAIATSKADDDHTNAIISAVQDVQGRLKTSGQALDAATKAAV